MTEKTQMQKELILSRMQPNKKYKVEEAAVWLAVGRTRARSLLKLLVEDGRITETGTTKMKRYQRLQEYEPAYTNWTNMPQSVKKTYTRAYLDAKTQAGQEKRIAWMVERLNKNLRPM